jgi:hypothetical protein
MLYFNKLSQGATADMDTLQELIVTLGKASFDPTGTENRSLRLAGIHAIFIYLRGPPRILVSGQPANCALDLAKDLMQEFLYEEEAYWESY